MKTYTFDTQGKVSKDTTISLFSDLHFDGHTNPKKLKQVVGLLEKTKPNYIFLLGDIVQDTYMSYALMNKLYEYLSDIGEIAPVFLIYGNHDMQTKKDGKWVRSINEDYYSMLNDINNLTVLDNESTRLPENIGLTGITLPLGYYNNLYENSNKYLELLKDILKYNPLVELDNSSYNIILQHSPNNISNKEIYLEFLKMIKKDLNFDLVISGHLHNGLVPSYLDKFVPGNRGFVGLDGTKFSLFKDGCRGIKDITDDTKCIILPAITSLPEYPKLDKLFPVNNKTLVLKK